MSDQASAFNVAQKSCAQADAFMSAFDETRQIGHDECAHLFAGVAAVRNSFGRNNTERGLESCEWIIGNFRACGGNSGNECGFSGIRKSDETEIAFAAEFARLMFTRSLMPGFREMLIAASAASTFYDHHAFAGLGEIGQH